MRNLLATLFVGLGAPLLVIAGVVLAAPWVIRGMGAVGMWVTAYYHWVLRL